MNTVNVRPAAPGDIPILAALYDDYRRFYGQTPDLQKASRFIQERFQRNESIVLVSAIGTGPISGFCQMYPTFCSVEAAKILVLYDLFVAPDSRRHGMGRALVVEAERYAKKHGYSRMDLSTARNNTSAQALYESLGWTRDDEFHVYHRRID